MPIEVVDQEQLDNLRQRYERAMHAMQSGVAAGMAIDETDCTPKHLRVGVNSALADQGALAKLLVDKGIITEVEYMRAIAEGAEAEQARYETLLTRVYGTKVTLK